MTPNKKDFAQVLNCLYYNQEFNSSLRFLANQIKKAGRRLTLDEVDQTTADKLNRAVDVLGEFNLAKGFFIHADFQDLCIERLKGQNNMLAVTAT